ncbi:sialate O-acetylesterase [Chitinophagaceae bacterium LB-8]|uniref:Sialate O-acetylesterase n=1 Tax=Paraflavisolibacter caeni TaxID=2982496 RepID=A0A9X3BHT1_9BACT|nr:sialate O-acetylesterase [Paraflavisolibacter caeni]MCU7550147.1 sialate O-acetylesterase [Paraflavisolibacter caeni]
MRIRTVVLSGLLFHAMISTAQVKLPQLVRDSMVLQRESKVKIWGWASKGEKVTIRFNGKQFRTTTGSDGKWSILLPPMKAGGPYQMDISSSNHLTLKDILIGDVWLCAGQSNMVHQMELHKERYAADIASANYPQIRHFWIPTLTDLQGPKEDLPTGFWKWANPEDVRQFSAVAYFFARSIYEKYKVPIGLINTSVGGTPIEAWTSEEGLKEFPEVVQTIQKNKDTAYTNSMARAVAAYNYTSSKRKEADKGLTGPKPWFDASYVPKDWRRINIPGYWEDQGIKDLNGVVWYRREIEVPPSMTGVPAKVCLGRIVDADYLYVNGKLVGNTTYQYPQRRYLLPAGVLKPGKNIFTIRVINQSGKGGFVPDKPYCLVAGRDTLDLKGYWEYKVGDVFIPQNNVVTGLSVQNQPTALFNAMVAPVVGYNIKGMLWYQGESNAGKPEEYAKLLPALIRDWRQKWNQGDLPFLYVQLPNFMEVAYSPTESNWALMREAQLKALSVPNTAMAVAIDLGEWNDIHPDNKKDVGLRLALSAQKLAYGGKDIVASGPLYQSSKVEEGKIVITFNNAGSGLISNDGEELSEFAIAGTDGKFVWAKAKIEGYKVIVWNESIPDPKYVRYAWADNPDHPNLYNKEGLPASPFRTDVTDKYTAISK